MASEQARERPRQDDVYERLYDACRSAYDEIIDFVTTDAFKALYRELMSLEPTKRPTFVVDVLLKDSELAKRGIIRPVHLLIQRSAFGDRRPTLFCVKKFLPPEFQTFWKNVNVTFDNEFDDDAIPRDARAWRAPLPVAIQHEYLSGNLNEAEVDAIASALHPADRPFPYSLGSNPSVERPAITSSSYTDEVSA
jgi:hypothetical protein